MNMLKLKGPTQVVLNITNQCNLRCSYCFNRSGGDGTNDELDDNGILDVVRQLIAVGVHNVCFSGGEPLLRAPLTLECMNMLMRNGIRTNVVTNGMLLDAGLIKQLKQAGCHEIQVSLDGATAPVHDRLRGRGSFVQVEQTLRLLRKADFPSFGTSMVISPHNYNAVEAVIGLLRKIGVPVLVLRPMLLLGRASGRDASLQVSPAHYRKLTRFLRAETCSGNGLRILYPDPLSQLYESSVNSDRGCFGMEIKANGDLIVAPYIQLPLGNLKRYTVGEYWAAGWPYAWRMPILKQLASMVMAGKGPELDARIKEIGRRDLIEDGYGYY